MGNKDRGSGTHGHGSSKKTRGAGNRGGRGKAGRGKKATHKKMQGIEEDHLGEHGFTRPGSTDAETINLQEIDQRIDRFVAEGVAEETDGGYRFDAEGAGFDKVLGGGRLTKDIDITAPAFSDSAREQIEASGNEASVTDE